MELGREPATAGNGTRASRGVSPQSEALLNVLRPYCMSAVMSMEDLLAGRGSVRHFFFVVRLPQGLCTRRREEQTRAILVVFLKVASSFGFALLVRAWFDSLLSCGKSQQVHKRGEGCSLAAVGGQGILCLFDFASPFQEATA